MEKEYLILWEPLKDNLFERFYNPMFFVNLHFDGDFILTFRSFEESLEYKFTYKKDEANFYAIRHFRMLEEFCRSDIEILIDEAREEREALGLPRLTYNPTFYKIQNSSFLAWYRSVDPSFPLPEHCHIEHHLYITDNYFIDVLSEQQPFITISTYNEDNGLI